MLHVERIDVLIPLVEILERFSCQRFQTMRLGIEIALGIHDKRTCALHVSLIAAAIHRADVAAQQVHLGDNIHLGNVVSTKESAHMLLLIHTRICIIAVHIHRGRLRHRCRIAAAKSSSHLGIGCDIGGGPVHSSQIAAAIAGGHRSLDVQPGVGHGGEIGSGKWIDAHLFTRFLAGYFHDSVVLCIGIIPISAAIQRTYLGTGQHTHVGSHCIGGIHRISQRSAVEGRLRIGAAAQILCTSVHALRLFNSRVGQSRNETAVGHNAARDVVACIYGSHVHAFSHQQVRAAIHRCHTASGIHSAGNRCRCCSVRRKTANGIHAIRHAHLSVVQPHKGQAVYQFVILRLIIAYRSQVAAAIQVAAERAASHNQARTRHVGGRQIVFMCQIIIATAVRACKHIAQDSAAAHLHIASGIVHPVLQRIHARQIVCHQCTLIVKQIGICSLQGLQCAPIGFTSLILHVSDSGRPCHAQVVFHLQLLVHLLGVFGTHDARHVAAAIHIAQLTARLHLHIAGIVHVRLAATAEHIVHKELVTIDGEHGTGGNVHVGTVATVGIEDTPHIQVHIIRVSRHPSLVAAPVELVDFYVTGGIGEVKLRKVSHVRLVVAAEQLSDISSVHCDFGLIHAHGITTAIGCAHAESYTHAGGCIHVGGILTCPVHARSQAFSKWFSLVRTRIINSKGSLCHTAAHIVAGIRLLHRAAVDGQGCGSRHKRILGTAKHLPQIDTVPGTRGFSHHHAGVRQCGEEHIAVLQGQRSQWRCALLIAPGIHIDYLSVRCGNISGFHLLRITFCNQFPIGVVAISTAIHLSHIHARVTLVMDSNLGAGICPLFHHALDVIAAKHASLYRGGIDVDGGRYRSRRVLHVCHTSAAKHIPLHRGCSLLGSPRLLGIYCHSAEHTQGTQPYLTLSVQSVLHHLSYSPPFSLFVDVVTHSSPI